MSFFFSFLSFSFKLREREGGVYEIGYKEKQSQNYLSYLDGFLWRIFILLRANRLYLIFSTGLKIRLLLVRDFFFFVFFYPALGSVRHEPCPITDFLLFISADGKESPLLFQGPSQSFGFSLLPSRVRRPEGGHRVQTSVLNGHSLTACYC